MTSTFNNDLHVLDVVNPTNPLHVAMFALTALSWTLSPEADHTGTPNIVGQIQTICITCPGGEPAKDVARATSASVNQYAYIVDRNLGVLDILDIRTPEKPEQIGVYAAPAERSS